VKESGFATGVSFVPLRRHRRFLGIKRPLRIPDTNGVRQRQGLADRQIMLPELKSRFASATNPGHKLSVAFALAGYGYLDAGGSSRSAEQRICLIGFTSLKICDWRSTKPRLVVVVKQFEAGLDQRVLELV